MRYLTLRTKKSKKVRENQMFQERHNRRNLHFVCDRPGFCWMGLLLAAASEGERRTWCFPSVVCWVHAGAWLGWVAGLAQLRQPKTRLPVGPSSCLPSRRRAVALVSHIVQRWFNSRRPHTPFWP